MVLQVKQKNEFLARATATDTEEGNLTQRRRGAKGLVDC